MLLKSAKKFFKNTIKSFKSLLSGGYEKLPKTPPFNPFSCSGQGDPKMRQSFRELDNFYLDFTDGWDYDEQKPKQKTKKKDKEVNTKLQSLVEDSTKKKLTITKHEGDIKSSHKLIEEGNYLVIQRLKELASMDTSNADHVLDIEEVLHYYSRLTCPAYLEIVDRFFMQMYSEFFKSTTSIHKSCK